MLSMLSIIMNVAEDRCVSVWRHACFVFISEVLECLVAALDRWPWWALLALAHELRNARRRVAFLAGCSSRSPLGPVEQLQQLHLLLHWAGHRACVLFQCRYFELGMWLRSCRLHQIIKRQMVHGPHALVQCYLCFFDSIYVYNYIYMFN